MLIGLLKCDDGSIYIQKYNVTRKSGFNNVKKFLGICTQSDVLYDLLTCYEHLELYARLKGLQISDTKLKITELLASVDLLDLKHTYSLKLRDGEKRRLCLAIALIGDPKILILDEPTEGMVRINIFLAFVFLFNFQAILYVI